MNEQRACQSGERWVHPITDHGSNIFRELQVYLHGLINCFIFKLKKQKLFGRGLCGRKSNDPWNPMVQVRAGIG